MGRSRPAGLNKIPAQQILLKQCLLGGKQDFSNKKLKCLESKLLNKRKTQKSA